MTTLATSDQATGLDSCRDIKSRVCSISARLALASPSALLRRRLGIERAERVRDRPPTVSTVDFELRRIGVRAPPEEVVALRKRLFH